MMVQKSAARRLPLVVLMVLLVGALLTGCIRSVLGSVDAICVLAAGRVTAAAPIRVGGAVGGGSGIDAAITSAVHIIRPEEMAPPLKDAALVRDRLLRLPSTHLAPGALTAPVTPGFYQVNGPLVIAPGQTVTLSGNGVFVFNVSGDLEVGDGAQLVLTDGALPANIFWSVDHALIGPGSNFAGTILANGDILASGAQLFGKLISLAGNVAVGGAQIVDGTASSEVCPKLQTQTVPLRWEAGTPFWHTAYAYASETAPIRISALYLPPGATHYGNAGGVDTNGPNGSDVLLEAVPPPGQQIGTSCYWEPAAPGTYRFLYFAQTPGATGIPGGTRATPFEGQEFNGAIDFSGFTVTVFPPMSTRGTVYGTGGFGGVNGGRFQLAVTARRDGPDTAGGNLTVRIPSEGIDARSATITALKITDLGGGQKSALVLGTMRVAHVGVVPFLARVVDAGSASGEMDQFSLTLVADLNRDGVVEQAQYASTVNRGGSVRIP